MRSAIQLASCAMLALLLLVSHATAKDPVKQASATEANPLVIGDGYTIRAERNGVKETLQGVLVKANDRWLVLQQVRVLSLIKPTPFLSGLPLVGSAFHRSSPVRTDDFLWIPREAASVEKRITNDGRFEVQVPATDTPPTQVACTIEVAAGRKVVQRKGGMEAQTAETFTISLPTETTLDVKSNAMGLPELGASTRKETRYERQRIARQDVLCIRVANFDPAHMTAAEAP